MDDPFRRILIALDAATYSATSIDAVVELAALLRAELHGLFVEDADLLALTGLPVTRKVSLLTGAGEVVDVESSAREMRAVPASVERRLALAAERREVKWSFRVARGSIVEEITAASERVDALIVRCPAMSPGGVASRGTPAAAAERVSRPVLMLPSRSTADGPVAVLYDGSAGADRALELAALLAARRERPVRLLLWSAPAAVELEQRASALLAGRSAAVTVARVDAFEMASLRGRLRESGAGMLVLGAAAPLPGARTLRQLPDALDLPVLAVRAP